MKSPKKAFVLAAGFGTRMLPLTRDLPKPLLPLWGKPVLEHVLDLLKRWGVEEVLINVHHKSDEMLTHILKRARKDMEINLSFEPEILGTGGALRKAEWFIVDGPLWLINADVVCDVKPTALLRAFKPKKTLASAWLQSLSGPRTVEARRGYVSNWRSKHPGAVGTYTFTGLQLISPNILRYLPGTGFASLITAYEKAMADGWKIAGVEVPGSFWADIGTPGQYLEAHRAWKKRKTFAAIDVAAYVARGAHVKNSVVMSGVHIHKGAHIENAVIGRNTVVHGHVGYMALPAVSALDDAEKMAVKKLGWPIEHTTALPLGPRGSARTFTRLRRGIQNVILVHYSSDRYENTLYVGHARFLKRAGLHVPSVLADFPQESVTLFEDLGDRCVQHVVRGMGEVDVERLYRRILDAVLILHKRGTRAVAKSDLELVPAFRPRLYRWEHDLFADHLLKGRLHLPEGQMASIKKDLSRVATHLLREPSVLVHRDLQSSNILLHRGEPAFIDFQGMRYGPAVYDLASLLCDPYVEFSQELQERLLAYYAVRSGRKNMIERTFWYGAVQRLVQALGAYGRLAESPDTSSFSKYIPPAILMLHRALGHVDGLSSLKSWCRDALPTVRG